MIEHYLSLVCKWYGVTIDEVMSIDKTSRVVIARQSLHYLLRNVEKLTLKEVGRLTGRDHTSVMHSLSTIDDLIGQPYGKQFKPLFDYLNTPRSLRPQLKMSYWAYPGIDMSFNGLKRNTDKVRS